VVSVAIIATAVFIASVGLGLLVIRAIDRREQPREIARLNGSPPVAKGPRRFTVLRDTFVLVVPAGVCGWLLSNIQPMSWLQWRPLIDPAAPYPSLFESFQWLLLHGSLILFFPFIPHILACWGMVALAHFAIRRRPMVRDVVAGFGTVILSLDVFLGGMIDTESSFHPATDRLSVTLQESNLVWAGLSFASYLTIQTAARRLGWWNGDHGELVRSASDRKGPGALST
jgi:hypothetical protein